MHIPSVHPLALGASQALLQAPQWLGVLLVSMHVPLQQLSVEPQALPQEPQFRTSRCRSRHSPPQQDRPVGHAAPVPHMHVPPTQLSPGAQAGEQVLPVVHVPSTHLWSELQVTPHPPQLFGSVAVLMHAPPQHPSPSSQGSEAPQRHAPSTQLSPGAHAGVHTGLWHTPATHVSPASTSQETPQAPQCVVEVDRSAHVPPQQVSPAAHRAEPPHRHVPDVHLSPVGEQTFPQAPQCSASFPTSTHTPSQHVDVPSQGISELQGRRHRPSRHTWPAAQGGLQAAVASIPGVEESRPPSPVPPGLRPPWAHPSPSTRVATAAVRAMERISGEGEPGSEYARIVHGAASRSTSGRFDPEGSTALSYCGTAGF